MKANPHHLLSRKGALLPVALVLTILGGIFISSFVAMSTMRAVSARAYEDAARRRLALENSKAFASQIAREKAFFGNDTLTQSTTAMLATDWGGISTDNGWSNMNVFALPPTTGPSASGVQFPGTGTAATNFPHNQLGLRPGNVFTTIEKLVRPTGMVKADPFDAYLFLKSATPCLNGDPWVYYRKPDGESAEIEGKNAASNVLYYLQGRLVIRDPASFFSASEIDRGSKARLTLVPERGIYIQKYDPLNRCTANDNTGSELLPLNLPAAPSTSGDFPNGAPLTPAQLHRGELAVIGEVPAPPAAPVSPYPYPNTLWGIQERESATATPTAILSITSDTPFGSPSTDAVWLKRYDTSTGPSGVPDPRPVGWATGAARYWNVLHIRLDHPNLPNIRIFNYVHQVVLEGQNSAAAYRAASRLDPRIILLYSMQGVSLQPIQVLTMRRENARRIVLGVKGDRVFRNFNGRLQMQWHSEAAGGIGVGAFPDTPGDPATPLTMDWRMVLVNEGRPVQTYLPGGGGSPDSVQITGGFMTNWTIWQNTNVAATRFKIQSDWTAPYRFATLCPRDAWLESYFRLTQS
jgi:hypothetical protein